jgi:hypothetical protein
MTDRPDYTIAVRTHFKDLLSTNDIRVAERFFKMMDRYDPSSPHRYERPPLLLDLTFGIEQTWSKSKTRGKRAMSGKIVEWHNRRKSTLDEEQPFTCALQLAAGDDQNMSQMSGVSGSNQASDSQLTNASTDPGPVKSDALRKKNPRTDYICMAIGRENDWRLCHVRFPVNEQGIHHDGLGNAATDAELFKKIREAFNKELSKTWLRQIVFPEKLSRVEYWEVST